MLKMETSPHGCPPRTQWHADAVALGVQQPPDLGQVAVVAPVVLVHGGLQEEGVLGVEDAGDAFLRALHEDAGLLGLHVVPHALVGLVPRVLGWNRLGLGMGWDGLGWMGWDGWDGLEWDG